MIREIIRKIFQQRTSSRLRTLSIDPRKSPSLLTINKKFNLKELLKEIIRKSVEKAPEDIVGRMIRELLETITTNLEKGIEESTEQTILEQIIIIMKEEVRVVLRGIPKPPKTSPQNLQELPSKTLDKIQSVLRVKEDMIQGRVEKDMEDIRINL